MLVKGYYERIGQVGAFLTHKVNGEKHHFEHPAKNHEKAIQFVMKRLTSDHYGVFKSLDEFKNWIWNDLIYENTPKIKKSMRGKSSWKKEKLVKF